MSPLSILPGRIRFESPLLVGREKCCRLLEHRASAVEGVVDISANHRTGRIRILFDERTLSYEALAARIKEELAGCTACDAAAALQAHTCAPGRCPKTTGETSSHPAISRDLIWDALAHALLPSPFDQILPSAMSLFSRNSAEVHE